VLYCRPGTPVSVWIETVKPTQPRRISVRLYATTEQKAVLKAVTETNGETIGERLDRAARRRYVRENVDGQG
jgi:hypothetical protein